ncbi:metal-sensitive transcriptional regulator [Salinisphaera hydrothermalis]|uniref:metal-sensitive transcriptional regulator n=1 Tax=Salinisphaera hydrothermalis TaxID=563188 RepID=UPI0033422203
MSDIEPDETRLALDPAVRYDARSRLRSIRGHVDGVLRMLERDDVYCVDALKQIKAVNGALAKTGDMILRCHLKHHVVTAHQRGDDDAIVAELMDILKYR